ncbi:hypothetical protein K1719_044138 [Acacia pycnantha]|nr:hypothetical protein K1719_044138 [Acacia pycnantha]
MDKWDIYGHGIIDIVVVNVAQGAACIVLHLRLLVFDLSPRPPNQSLSSGKISGFDLDREGFSDLGKIPQEDMKSTKHNTGKVRSLCIDGTGATSRSSLWCLHRKSRNPNAHIATNFNVVAGSSVGGVLAALLFTRRRDGFSMFSAEEALKFLVKNWRKIIQL